MELIEHFLAEQRVRFPVSQVSGRRTDQFGDFVRVLKFRAIDFDYRVRVAHQALCQRFHRTGFSRAGRSQKQEVTHRTSRARHARLVGLINVNDLLNCLVLTDNLSAQV